MQNALQNPNYKKIWEEVNWKIRHPEAKSLEEALEFEKKHSDCVFIYNDISGYCGENCIYLREEISNYNALANEHCESLNFFEKKKFMKMIDSNAKILGRSITLEDILLLLKGYFAGINLDISGIFKFNAIGQPADWSIIEWDFTKPLHEQTHETWEKIANLI